MRHHAQSHAVPLLILVGFLVHSVQHFFVHEVEEPKITMIGILMSVIASCDTCCNPGGNCDAAYKGESGVCCGYSYHNGYQCCPGLSVCVACNGGTFRCAYPGQRGAMCPQFAEEIDLLYIFSVGIVASILLLSCCGQKESTHPVVVHGVPYETAVLATGFVGGVVVADAMEAGETSVGFSPDE